MAALRRLIDYQDPAYAGEYLDRMDTLAALDRQHGGDAAGWGRR